MKWTVGCIAREKPFHGKDKMVCKHMPQNSQHLFNQNVSHAWWPNGSYPVLFDTGWPGEEVKRTGKDQTYVITNGMMLGESARISYDNGGAGGKICLSEGLVGKINDSTANGGDADWLFGM